MRKWLPVLIYAAGIIAAWIYKSDILDWMQNNHSPILSVGVATLLAFFPVVPYKAVISLYGYVYGTLPGALLCWLATTLAAALMFLGVRYWFQGRARTYLSKIKALEKFTAAIERRPFAAVVLARLAPVIPQTAVNVYAGAAGLPFWSFLLASGLGKIPGIALFAYLGGSRLRDPGTAVIAVLLYVTVIGLAAWSMRPRSPRPVDKA